MCFNNWQAYLKILIEFVVCCLIVALLIYLFKTKDLNIALIIGLVVIIIFGILDCFLIRGTCFKISENLENEEEEPKKEKTLDDLKDEDKKIQKILKGYLNGKELKIKNLKVSEKIEGAAIKKALNVLYPVGSLLISDKNPSETLGFGEWSLLVNPDSDLRFIKLVDPNEKERNNLTGGENVVKLEQKHIPYHDHNIFDYQTVQGFTYHMVFCDVDGAAHKFVVRSFTEGNDAGAYKETKEQGHNNIPPFIAVNLWVRNK